MFSGTLLERLASFTKRDGALTHKRNRTRLNISRAAPSKMSTSRDSESSRKGCARIHSEKPREVAVGDVKQRLEVCTSSGGVNSSQILNLGDTDFAVSPPAYFSRIPLSPSKSCLTNSRSAAYVSSDMPGSRKRVKSSSQPRPLLIKRKGT